MNCLGCCSWMLLCLTVFGGMFVLYSDRDAQSEWLTQRGFDDIWASLNNVTMEWPHTENTKVKSSKSRKSGSWKKESKRLRKKLGKTLSPPQVDMLLKRTNSERKKSKRSPKEMTKQVWGTYSFCREETENTDCYQYVLDVFNTGKM